MRGAGLRLNVDVRRHWKCPVCGAERRQPATVTTVKCGCAARAQMQLIEGQRRDRGIVPPPDPVLEFDLSNDPVTIPENLPVPDPNQRFGRSGPRNRRPGPPGGPPGLGPDPGQQGRSEPSAGPVPPPTAEQQSGGPPQEREGRGQGPRGEGGSGRPEQGGRDGGGRPRRSRDRPPKGAPRNPDGDSRPPRVEQNAPSTSPPAPTQAASSEPQPGPASQPQTSAPEDFGAGLEGPAAS